MKNAEIRQLTTKELVERIDTEKSILSRMKFNHAISPLDNPLKIKEAKKTVAQLLTELSNRKATDK